MKMKYIPLILVVLCSLLLNIKSIAQTTNIEVPYLIPQEVEELQPRFHFAPVNQDTTNACWSFSTLSFIESELQRINGQSIKLAVMYPVYYGFIEKAKKYIQTRGESRFTPGDLFNTVVEIIKQYGMVPEEVYLGQVVEHPTHNHNQMEIEIEVFKNQIIDNTSWDEKTLLTEFKDILNSHLSEPPDSFSFRGESFTPLTFAAKYVNLPWDEYLLVTSFGYAPFESFTSLNVPDNWQGVNRYFNVSLDLFYNSMKTALNNGYSLVIDGDIKEPGRMGPQDICIIPDFDIPGSYINQDARDYRFEKGVTQDDHLMHIVGFGEVNGEEWFLIKDSWRDSFEGKHKGYFFYHKDYAKLKILAYMVHKDGVPAITERIVNNARPEQ
jgi:bleomycin hydrolase